ncbi:LD-carboxypeptidase [Allosphingosinicella sp.]|jgi:muramoyltetrapeptide carboxypeptidase|uniref:LD-carboxypeptidase n=1 Tax=Allosphingosinicella sp. TaxID=2823234 RepID=UPI002EFE06E8
MRIAVVAPSTPIGADVAGEVIALAAVRHPAVELRFHPQCFLTHKHFAGDDRARTEALIEAANDPEVDAVWFARGGYGSCRIAEEVLARLGLAARDKTYLGYSDAGFLLGALYRAGIGQVAHGPMPRDMVRPGGHSAVARALDWLVGRSADALEPTAAGGAPSAAFNITVFAHMIGTSLQPDLEGQVLMLEDVSEHMYRTDRAMFHITSNADVRKVAGIRLGRCSEVPDNDPDFGETQEQVFRHWCGRSGIPYLGRADIGHDSDNKVVPFGLQ